MTKDLQIVYFMVIICSTRVCLHSESIKINHTYSGKGKLISQTVSVFVLLQTHSLLRDKAPDRGGEPSPRVLRVAAAAQLAPRTMSHTLTCAAKTSSPICSITNQVRPQLQVLFFSPLFGVLWFSRSECLVFMGLFFLMLYSILSQGVYGVVYFFLLLSVVLSHYKLQFVTVMKYGALRSWNSDVSCQNNFLKLYM